MKIDKVLCLKGSPSNRGKVMWIAQMFPFYANSGVVVTGDR